ncbi:MAG: hypothetical protein WC342_02650 [Methanoregula sp.]
MSPRKTIPSSSAVSDPVSGKVETPHSPGGQDKGRHREHHTHHPEKHPASHPPHSARKKPMTGPRHHPHIGAAEIDLNTDHGTHEDRPRPGKLAKKEQHVGR